MTEQEQFEQWAQEKGFSICRVGPGLLRDQVYASIQTAYLWQGWQARSDVEQRKD